VQDQDEQAWLAERRAFVANWRDGARLNVKLREVARTLTETGKV
jgi:hypothetical protein